MYIAYELQPNKCPHSIRSVYDWFHQTNGLPFIYLFIYLLIFFFFFWGGGGLLGVDHAKMLCVPKCEGKGSFLEGINEMSFKMGTLLLQSILVRIFWKY